MTQRRAGAHPRRTLPAFISDNGGAGAAQSSKTAPYSLCNSHHRALSAQEKLCGGALVEMYLARVSVRKEEDITEALWGSRESPSTISDLNRKIFERV